MIRSHRGRLPRLSRVLAGALLPPMLALLGLQAAAAPAEPDPAASAGTPAQAMRAQHRRLSDKLERSSFGRPVQLESVETPDGLQGDVYAVVEHPLADVGAALKGSANWCELMLLHVNNRRCRVSGAPGHETLTLYVVRRYDKPVEQAFELPFAYRVASATPEHMLVDLSAASGPFGTRNYHVTLEAVALDERRSFLHFSYSYDHNLMVKYATQAYLATFGRDKVGFTVVGQAADGKPEYIRGLRGLVERNAMRYFLTLDAYLAADAAGQAERRQRHWFAASEQYPRQLHEIDLNTYLALKREDRQRDGLGE